MEQIKVGEHVRTNEGIIAKLVKINELEQYRFDNIVDTEEISDVLIPCELSCIKKHSFNIIDLIEVGDYVNCNKVLSVVTDLENKDVIGLKFLYNDNILWFSSKDIKSIVTKEQFESIKYEVK